MNKSSDSTQLLSLLPVSSIPTSIIHPSIQLTFSWCLLCVKTARCSRSGSSESHIYHWHPMALSRPLGQSLCFLICEMRIKTITLNIIQRIYYKVPNRRPGCYGYHHEARCHLSSRALFKHPSLICILAPPSCFPLFGSGYFSGYQLRISPATARSHPQGWALQTGMRGKPGASHCLILSLRIFD